MSSNSQLDEALSLIIANTQRKKRIASISEIAQAIAAASDGLGGVPALSERIGLSETMLHQFLSVNRLDPRVRELFEKRELDSVDLSSQLSGMSPEDQLELSFLLKDRRLSTKDVRSIREMRKRDAESPISDLADAALEANPEKHYIYEFVLRGGLTSEQAEDRLSGFLGQDNLLSFDSRGLFARLTTNKRGRGRISAFAKEKRVTGDQAIALIVSGKGGKEAV